MNKKEFLQERLKGVQYIQSEKCAKCGECCAHGSCSVLPMDIEPFTVENVMREIELGKYSIELEVIGCGATFSGLHVSEVGSGKIDIYKPHTRCTLLKEKGCMLNEVTRPAFALAFVPGDPCEKMITEEDYFQMWGREQDTMEQAVRICSGGKSSFQLMLEYFDKVAREIYVMLLNQTKARDYTDIHRAFLAFGKNLYKEITKISNCERTTDRIIARLVSLEANAQTAIQDPNGHNFAARLLHFSAYGMLEKFPSLASVEEKIEACLRYDQMNV